MRGTTNESTREYLLDVADEIVARDGLHALTIRSVTRAARANVASVNYFFGSKDGLLMGLQERMFRPMTQERLDRFDALQQAGSVHISDVVRALIEPLARMRARHGRSAAELYRYLLASPTPKVRAASWELLEPGLRRFEQLTLLALPDRPRDRLLEQAHLVCQIAVPAVLSALDVFDLAHDSADLEGLMEFIVGGLAAAPGVAAPVAVQHLGAVRRS